MKIVVLQGSPNKNGSTAILTESLKKVQKKPAIV